ncbi:MAG: TRAP transporter substrate-binding protein [Azospirillaceae bacterium]
MKVDRLKSAVAVSAMLVAAGVAAAPAAAQEVSLRMESPVGMSFLWSQIYVRFADTVAERTNGDVEIQIFANSELSRDTVTQFENIQAGTVDGAVVNSQPLSVFDDRLNVFSLPFQAANAEQYYAILDGPGQELWASAFENLGVVGIPEASSMGGFRQLTNSVRPVRTVDDIEGLTIRMPGSPLYQDVWDALNVNTTSMPFGELIGALETGVVDGQENPTNIIEAGRLYEYQDYLTIWNYSNSALTFAFNQDSWNQLSAEQQQIFREEAVNAANWHREEIIRVDEELLERYQAEGLFEEVTFLTDAEIAAFKEAIQPVYDVWTERLGAEVIEPFLP